MSSWSSVNGALPAPRRITRTPTTVSVVRSGSTSAGPVPVRRRPVIRRRHSRIGLRSAKAKPTGEPADAQHRRFRYLRAGCVDDLQFSGRAGRSLIDSPVMGTAHQDGIGVGESLGLLGDESEHLRRFGA